jgi:hypothetical protein
MIRLSLFLYLMAVSLAIGAQTCNGTLSAPDSRYAVAANGMTVLDQQTGLIWARCPNGMNWDGAACAGTATSYTWQEALTAADTSTLAGYTDWRLPNIKELISLVEPGCVDPALNTRIFPNTASWFWSSSPYVGSAYSAWYVYFGYGDVYDDSRGSSLAVRLVRGG